MCFSSCIYIVSMSMNISISMSMSMRCMDTNCVTILYSMSLQNEHPEIYKRGKCVQCINSTRSIYEHENKSKFRDNYKQSNLSIREE